MIDVLVVEDHPMFRFGLVSRLALESDLAVVGEAASVAEALELVERTSPDVVLVYLNLPDGSGLDLIPQIVAVSPRSACLVLTMRDDASAYAAIRAGSKGYLLKDASSGSVVSAIRSVAGGDVVLGPPVVARLLAASAATPHSPAAVRLGLSQREETVMRLMADGLTNAAIARRLDLTPKTVPNYVSTVIGKLNATNRDEAIAEGRRLLPPARS